MTRLFIIAGVLAAVAGCKKGRADQCGDLWDRSVSATKEAIKEFGGSDGDMLTDDDKKVFMAECTKAPDDVFACMTDPSKMMDQKCQDAVQKYEDSIPVEPVKLEWESADAIGKQATAQVPKGWKHEEFAGDQWSPGDDKRDFSMATYSIESGCGGDCSPMSAADWAKRVDENEFTDLEKQDGAQIVKDEKIGDTGRIAIVKTKELGPMTTVLAVFWKDQGEEYVMCKAEIDRKYSANVDDFEKACRGLKVSSFAATEGGGGGLGDDIDGGAGTGSDAGAAAGSGSASASGSSVTK
jgi:hypothetical protein